MYMYTRMYAYTVYPCVNGASNHFWDTNQVSFNSSPMLPCHWVHPGWARYLPTRIFRTSKILKEGHVRYLHIFTLFTI
jgi:hypothetical protein